MSKRRIYTPPFKAQVVLAVLTGVKTAAQVCREHSLKDTLVSRWKQEFVERAPQLFAGDEAQAQQQARIADLERLVGQLTMELEIAKKASLYSSSAQTSSGH